MTRTRAGNHARSFFAMLQNLRRTGVASRSSCATRVLTILQGSSLAKALERYSMPLASPAHLQTLRSLAFPVSHSWEENDDMAALGRETPSLLDKLGALSFREVLALEAALGEWMYERFVHLYDDVERKQLNEALWAASVDYRYLRAEVMHFSREAVDADPIRGPLQLSKRGSRSIADFYHRAVFGAVRYVIGSVHLVKYVLPESKAFQTWFKAVVTRLPALSQPSAEEAAAFDVKRKKTEPRGVPDDIFGTPVPREAFDPAFDLASADSTALIDALLVSIASQPNPFLHSADELTDLGFEGTPYRFVIRH